MSPFYKIFKNIGALYALPNLLWQALFCTLTYLLVVSGADWQYFLATRGAVQLFAMPAVFLGSLVPVLLPAILLVAGEILKNKKAKITAYAIGQAEILGLAMTSLYKVFTGRPGPHGFGMLSGVAQNFTDITKVWRFGVYRGGAFQGWPSSHTAVAFAMAFAVIALCPKNKFIKWAVFLYALYVGLGVSMTIHWFSDFVAGAIFGAIIGITVGKSYLKLFSSQNFIS